MSVSITLIKKTDSKDRDISDTYIRICSKKGLMGIWNEVKEGKSNSALRPGGSLAVLMRVANWQRDDKTE